MTDKWIQTERIKQKQKKKRKKKRHIRFARLTAHSKWELGLPIALVC